MTTDAFTEAARAEAERRHPAPEIETGAQLGYTQTEIREVVRRTFTNAAEWARTHLAAHAPQVTIVQEDGQPATCEVRQGGVLIFTGRDHSADLRVTAQEQTDAEVEAAARALWAEVWIDPDEHPWDTEATGAERASCRREARAALSAARAARRDEEKR